MKLSVREFWSDDGPFYYIEDQETGTLDVVDITFASGSEAQAYLDTHREEIERKGLPPLSPEEVVEYWKTVDITEKNLDAGTLRISSGGGNPRYLLRLARQAIPLDESSLRRLESVIARYNLLVENARTEAAKSVLDAQEAELRLNLALTYLEMGDKEGALALLDEVVRQGDDAYKERACKMISEMSGAAS